MFSLVGPSWNSPTCHVCFQPHFSPDQCHFSFFLKLKTHICLKEVQVFLSFTLIEIAETSFYSHLIRLWNNQHWKTKKPSLICYLGVLVLVSSFFFLGGGGGSFATFLFTIKMITVHAAICTLLRYDCWRVRKFWNISHTALNFKRLLVIEKWPTKWHLELTLILCFMLPYH